MSRMFDVSATVDLLQYDFVQQALIAGAILGLLAGAIGPLIVSRQMSFAVHGTSELSLNGASAALLIGVSVGAGAIAGRSEEHTSELQSLMRNSYAVFCLKKKKQ